ncbi:hypothetical protein RFI_39647, partial [Reticulomyxa filosa]
IDLNLIYVALKDCCQGNINKTTKLLFEFEQWKLQDNNERKYKKRVNEFLERRCCSHNKNTKNQLLQAQQYTLFTMAFHLLQMIKKLTKININFAKVKFVVIKNFVFIILLLFINSNKKI